MTRLLGWLLVILYLAWPLDPAKAAEDNFYKGKTVTMLVPSGPGAGYDFYGRIVARYLAKYLPGEPTIVVQNMSGGGGIRQSNYLYNAAPKDGTVIAIMDQTLRLNQAFQEGIAYDTAKFYWLGRLAPALGLVTIFHSSPVKTLADMKSNEVVFAASGKGSQSYMIPTFMRTLLGYKTKIVNGYEGAAAIFLAMEQGEVQGRTGALEAITAAHPDWVANGTIRVVAELSLESAPAFPDAPLLTSLAPDQASRDVMEFVASYTAFGFPYAAPPGIPPERGLQLRRAFDAAVNSPELVADMKQSNMAVGAATGETIQALAERFSVVSPELITRTKKALEW